MTATVAVRVLPLDVTVEVRPGETLFAAARRTGLRWPSICGGDGACTVCFIRIEDGLERAGPEQPGERERLDFAGRREPAFRLACQTRPQGPLVVFKKGVKPAEAS